jgi:hypothetical protein
MTKPVSQQKLLWHLTALDNLESILIRGLLSRNSIQKFIDIADEEIIKKRTELGLENYVPFHFFQGNPFDGVVLKEYPQKKFCFITILRDLAKKNNYKILSKHPLSPDATIYEYNEGIEAINWDIVDRREYKDLECKQACMAECLAFECVKPKDFFSITVRTSADEAYVKSISDSILPRYSYHIDMKPRCFTAQGENND